MPVSLIMIGALVSCRSWDSVSPNTESNVLPVPAPAPAL
jgi:hypothetical protein